MRTRRQRRHMSTPPHPRGSHGPVQFPGELPRPRVRLGYDFHGLRARECIGKMCPFRARPPPMFAIVRSGACAQCSRRAAPHVCGENTAGMLAQREAMPEPHLMRTSVVVHHCARPATTRSQRTGPLMSAQAALARSSTAASTHGHGARPPVLHSANKTPRKCLWLLCAC